MSILLLLFELRYLNWSSYTQTTLSDVWLINWNILDFNWTRNTRENRKEESSTDPEWGYCTFFIKYDCEFWECENGAVIFWHITMRPRRECAGYIDSHMLVQFFRAFFFFFFNYPHRHLNTKWAFTTGLKENRAGRLHSIWISFFFNFQKCLYICFVHLGSFMDGMQHTYIQRLTTNAAQQRSSDGSIIVFMIWNETER